MKVVDIILIKRPVIQYVFDNGIVYDQHPDNPMFMENLEGRTWFTESVKEKTLKKLQDIKNDEATQVNEAHRVQAEPEQAVEKVKPHVEETP